MKILLMRHGAAEDNASADELRELSAAGREEVAAVVDILRRFLPHLDLLASSPLPRAIQTAEYLAEAFPEANVLHLNELRQERHGQELLGFLRGIRENHTVALVGHEPNLHELASFLLLAEKRNLMKLKNAGLCLLEFKQSQAAGTARLLWLMNPEQILALR